MKTCLLLGGSGFVGRHLTPKLIAEGYAVCNIDPKSDVPMTAEAFIEQEYRRQFTKWDLVVHLAANIEDVNVRVHGGVEMYQDIALDYAVANYVEKNPPKECVVWMTSCATDWAHEDPYSWVKLNGERLCAALVKKGVQVRVLRPFSGYGTDQAESYPFRAIATRAVQRQDPLTVWGSGMQERDFVHIDDLTDAIMLSRDKFPNGIPVPIGTGRGTNFIELAQEMAKAVGYSPQIFCDTSKASASPRRVCEDTIARTYGWNPKVTLEDGIRRAVCN